MNLNDMPIGTILEGFNRSKISGMDIVFIKKNSTQYQVIESRTNPEGPYKEYSFNDGSIWNAYDIEIQFEEVVIHGVKDAI